MPWQGFEQAVLPHSTQLCCVPWPWSGCTLVYSEQTPPPRWRTNPLCIWQEEWGNYWGEETMREINWEIVNCRHQNTWRWLEDKWEIIAFFWFGLGFFRWFWAVFAENSEKNKQNFTIFWQAQKPNLCIKILIFKELCNFKWYDNQQNPQNCSKKLLNL